MAVRPLIRPRPRVIAPPGLSAEELQQLPRVLSRVCECAGQTEHQGASRAPRQPVAIRPTTVGAAASVAKQSASVSSTEAKPARVKPTLPAFWQSRKVIIAASVAALVTAIGIGYQFRPKQQVIVVHPAKQPAAVATSPASNSPTTKPAFQPLSPAAPAASSGKETTSTASLMPRATWPAEKTTAATPTKNPTPQIQTATKTIDTRTSSNNQPAVTPMQENLPRMSPQFPQTTNPTGNTSSNPSVVYNPTMNASASPLASGYANQNNLPPQVAAPAYTASLPNYQPNMQPSQPAVSSDGSFGAYGGARFEGQIQPLPLRR